MTDEEINTVAKLDHKVIMSLLGMAGAILVQALVLVWWGSWYTSKQDSRLLAVEVDIKGLQNADRDSLSERRGVSDRLSRVETEFSASKQEVNRRLDRIETKIDRLIEAAR